MALKYLFVTQFVIQVIFAFTSPRSYGCQNVQHSYLNRQLRRCRRQDSPPLGLPANDNTINTLPNNLPFQNGRPFGNIPVGNGLQNSLPKNNGLPYGLPINNGWPTGLPIQNRLPVGLPNGFSINNGFPNGLPVNNRLPTSFPIINNGLPIGLQTGNGLATGSPIRNGFQTELPNGLPTGLPASFPISNGLPTGLPNTFPVNNGLANIMPMNGGLPNILPNGFGQQFVLPNSAPMNSISPLNTPQKIGSPFNNPSPIEINNGVFNSLPNGMGSANLPLNNVQSLNNIDGPLGNNLAIQNALPNNFQNTFPVNNEMPFINNPQNNNSPNGFITGNSALANPFNVQNELSNLNNMKFTYVPLRFDSVPENNIYNNNVANGYPAINWIQNNNGYQFNSVLPPNNIQPSNMMPDNGQISNNALNGISNYVPNVNYLPTNAMNNMPVFNNWGIPNRLPASHLQLISPEMFISNLQNDFEIPTLPNFLPNTILPNVPIDFQTVLPNNPSINTLRIEGFGNLPIINGLPVAGITETVTLLNGQFYNP